MNNQRTNNYLEEIEPQNLRGANRQLQKIDFHHENEIEIVENGAIGHWTNIDDDLIIEQTHPPFTLFPPPPNCYTNPAELLTQPNVVSNTSENEIQTSFTINLNKPHAGVLLSRTEDLLNFFKLHEENNPNNNYNFELIKFKLHLEEIKPEQKIKKPINKPPRTQKKINSEQITPQVKEFLLKLVNAPTPPSFSSLSDQYENNVNQMMNDWNNLLHKVNDILRAVKKTPSQKKEELILRNISQQTVFVNSSVSFRTTSIACRNGTHMKEPNSLYYYTCSKIHEVHVIITEFITLTGGKFFNIKINGSRKKDSFVHLTKELERNEEVPDYEPNYLKYKNLSKELLIPFNINDYKTNSSEFNFHIVPSKVEKYLRNRGYFWFRISISVLDANKKKVSTLLKNSFQLTGHKAETDRINHLHYCATKNDIRNPPDFFSPPSPSSPLSSSLSPLPVANSPNEILENHFPHFPPNSFLPLLSNSLIDQLEGDHAYGQVPHSNFFDFQDYNNNENININFNHNFNNWSQSNEIDLLSQDDEFNPFNHINYK